MISFLLAIIYVSFISLGLPDALLGAAWPTMQVEFEVPVSYMGAVARNHQCRNDSFQFVFRWSDTAFWHGQGHRLFCGSYGHCLAGL